MAKPERNPNTVVRRRLKAGAGVGLLALMSLGCAGVRREAGRRDDDASLGKALEAVAACDFQAAHTWISKVDRARPERGRVEEELARMESFLRFLPYDQRARGAACPGVRKLAEGREAEALALFREAYTKREGTRLLSLINELECQAGILPLTSEVTSEAVRGPCIFCLEDQRVYDIRQAVYDGNYPLALRRAQDLIVVDPCNVTAWELKGSAEFLMENRRAARMSWGRALEFQPNNEAVRSFLASYP